jgi:hypothetical protein
MGNQIYFKIAGYVDLDIEIDVKFKLQKCAACQDLPTLQFWSKSHYPFWPIMQIRKKGGWNLKKSQKFKVHKKSRNIG